MGASSGGAARRLEILTGELASSAPFPLMESPLVGLWTAELLKFQSRKGIVTSVNNRTLNPVLCFFAFIVISPLVGPLKGMPRSFRGIGEIREGGH